MSRLFSWLVLALMLLVFVAAGLALLPVPFTRDQGIYAYNAWMWLGDSVPFRDTFGHKGPLLYLVYAVSLKLSGGAMWGPNLFDLVSRTFAVVFAFLLGRDMAGRRAGLWSALFCGLPLLGIFNSCWWNAQAETFMLPFLAASAWLAAPWAKTRGFRAAASGFLSSQAVMLKPNAVVLALFLLAWLVATPRDVSFKRPAWFIAGLVLGCAPWLAYFSFTGGLLEMWEFLVVFNSFHVKASLEAFGAHLWTMFYRRFYTVFNLIPVMCLFLFLPPIQERERGALFFVACWLAASALMTLVQFRFFLYHLLVLIVPLGLAAGMGMDSLQGRLQRTSRTGSRVLSGLVIIWFCLVFGRAWHLIEESYQTFDYLSGRIDLSEYYARFSQEDRRGRGDFSLLASASAAHHVAMRTDSVARVLVFGYEPLVNYLSARRAPSRFEIDYPLTFEPLSGRAWAHRQRWRAEFMADLRSSPPAMVVLVDNDTNPLEPRASLEQARDFKEFWSWLQQGYEQAEVIEDFHFYVRPKKPFRQD